MNELLALDFMQRALLAALLVGVSAPMVGVFLLQRRLALIGDGMGHVALTGVAVGVLTGASPVGTALAVSVAAAVVIELIRVKGGASADVALAVVFYGGIAASVVIMSKAPHGSSASLTAYLFGSITTVGRDDLAVFGVLAVVVLAAVTVLRWRLFAVANDEEYARASGLPVLSLNLALAILTAVTVVVSMRVVGLLLISALMIVPNAAAAQVARSFRATGGYAVALGVLSAVGGVVVSFYADTPSGGTIVCLSIAVFLVLALGRTAADRARRVRHSEAEAHPHEHGPGCGHDTVPHGDHVDYLHDGHRHAAHEGHYDEHAPHESEAPATGVTPGGPGPQ